MVKLKPITTMSEKNQSQRHPQVRLRNRLLLAATLFLAIVNGVAGYFDLHDTVVVLVLNLLGVAMFVAAIVLEFMRMIPRKRWRALSFLMPSIGVMTLFCGRIMDAEGYGALAKVCIASGAVIILYGVICALHWRRYSLAHRDKLRQSRQKSNKK